MFQSCFNFQLVFFIIISLYAIDNADAEGMIPEIFSGKLTGCIDITDKCEYWAYHDMCFVASLRSFMGRLCCKSCKKFQMATRQRPPTDQPDCKALLDLGWTDNGVYEIQLFDQTDKPILVYCDMERGGWTTIQKRTDDSLDYNRNISDYAQGFGQIRGEHWIGLNAMHQLTATSAWTLRFDLESFQGETRWAEYDNFRVSAPPEYKLLFDADSYRGTAGSNYGLGRQHGMSFTTFDVDQDTSSSYNCADTYGGGGFWFAHCSDVATTGMPYGGINSIKWFDWKKYVALKSVSMAIKQI